MRVLIALAAATEREQNTTCRSLRPFSTSRCPHTRAFLLHVGVKNDRPRVCLSHQARPWGARQLSLWFYRQPGKWLHFSSHSRNVDLSLALVGHRSWVDEKVKPGMRIAEETHTADRSPGDGHCWSHRAAARNYPVSFRCRVSFTSVILFILANVGIDLH